MKRIIVYLIIVSLIHLMGCYYQQQMNPGEFDFEGNWNMQVATKDTVYNIKSGDYYYSSDTLFTNVSKPLDEKSNLNYTIGIPVKTIESIEAKKMDILGTVAIIGTIAIVIYALSTMGDFSP